MYLRKIKATEQNESEVSRVCHMPGACDKVLNASDWLCSKDNSIA